MQVLYSLRALSCTSLVPWLSIVLVAPAAVCSSPTHSAVVAFAAIIIAAVMLLLPVATFSIMLKEFFSEQQNSSAFRMRSAVHENSPIVVFEKYHLCLHVHVT
jgi:hypothetical protein